MNESNDLYPVTEYSPVDNHYIHLFNGGKMFYGNPEGCISLRDIAHSLSLICRWTGHTKYHYSVAQHSVLVSKYGPGLMGAKLEAKYRLLHDASEAWTGDCNKPLKTLLGKVFEDIEDRLQSAVWKNFGLDYPNEDMKRKIKHADHAVSLAESRQLFNNNGRHPENGLNMTIAGVQPAKTEIEQWSNQQAEEAFIERFTELW